MLDEVLKSPTQLPFSEGTISQPLSFENAVAWSAVFDMTQNNQRRGRLRPRYGYALLIVYLIGCAGGAWVVYRNHGRVPEVPPIPSVTK